TARCPSPTPVSSASGSSGPTCLPISSISGSTASLTTSAPGASTPSPGATMKPLRVLNCCHRSHLGGAQRRAVWIADPLRRHDIETTILFPDDEENDYEQWLRDCGQPYRRVAFPYLRGLRRPLNN